MSYIKTLINEEFDGNLPDDIDYDSDYEIEDMIAEEYRRMMSSQFPNFIENIY